MHPVRASVNEIEVLEEVTLDSMPRDGKYIIFLQGIKKCYSHRKASL
jgi:hypothetical protein